MTCAQYVRYSASDNAGNAETVRSVPVSQDLQAPTLSVSTLSDGSWTNTQTLNISGVVTDTGGVASLHINGGSVIVNSDGTYSDGVILADGPNSIMVTSTDNAGNQATNARTINYDAAAPVITIDQPADNLITRNSALTVSGSVDANSAVAGMTLNDVAVGYKINGSNFSSDLTLSYGMNTIEVTAGDLAGNTAAAKRTVTFDDQVPSLAITSPAQDIRTNQSVITIEGKVDDITGISVAVAVDGSIFTPPVVGSLFNQLLSLTEVKTYAVRVTATDQAGNSASVTRNIVYDAGIPDFVIAHLDVLPNIAAPGGSISVKDVTNNRGSNMAASTTSFYLSTDCALDGGDILLGSRAVPPLAGNESNTGTTAVAIPGGTPLGTYYIVAQAKSEATVTEADETNNTRCSAPITITGSDLVISSFYAPAFAKRGTSVSVTDVTKNRLPGAAGASTTGVYLSATTIGGSLIGSRPVAALAGGGSSTATYSVTIPTGTTPGTYYIIWKADYLGVSGEVDNTNNTKYRAITVRQ
jgi:hypothetical protein